MKYRGLVAFVALALIWVTCGASRCEDDTSTNTERTDVERQQDVYTKTQPPPFFDWSLERHLLIELYKARNSAVRTYSYVQNQYTQKIMWECPSIGFPIPANTQLTNPLMVPYSDTNQGGHVIAQPEPNGLYSSPSTTGTYVMCVNDDGKVSPAYREDYVQAYFVPMEEVGGVMRPIKGAKPTLSIDPNRP